MANILLANLGVGAKRTIMDHAMYLAEQKRIQPQLVAEIFSACEAAVIRRTPLSWFEEKLPGVTEKVVQNINATTAEMLKVAEVGSAQELLDQLSS